MTAPYVAIHPEGSRVRVAPRAVLDHFRDTWKWHHPLSADQLEWAGEDALVTEIAFYHGGTPLYVLRGRRGDSGYWHEVCLYGIGRVSQHPAPRIGDTVQASELFAILDAEIAEAGVRLDAVRFAIGDAYLSREQAEAWVNEGGAEGFINVRYILCPQTGGSLVIDLAAHSVETGQSGDDSPAV